MANADIFSLGCLLYYVITRGKHPFGGKVNGGSNILEGRNVIVDSDFTHEVMDYLQIIREMIVSDAHERPSCSDVLKELMRIRLRLSYQLN